MRALPTPAVVSVTLAIALAGACGGTIDDPTAAAEASPEAAVRVAPQPLHRLNRLEYDNTVRDLLGTTLRPAQAFPPDSESSGFDNMAASLPLSPTLLDRYYSAARAVIDDALDDRPAYLHRIRPADVGTGGHPVGELWRLQGNAFQVSVEVPEGGATVTLVAGGSRIGSAPEPALRFELDGAEVETFGVRGSAAALEAHAHALHLSAGSHTLRYAPANFINDAPANISNDVIVRHVEIRADAILRGPGRELVFFCEPTGEPADPCSQRILERFARRAWRRPLLPDERRAVFALFAELRADGEPDEQALRLVMRGILTSPKFVYRARTLDDTDDGEWLDDHVLATRLSYFLWSSMPDDALFEAADEGRLSTEEGIAEEVERMLADEKSRALIDGFAEQWLSTRGLATAAPSPEVYPGFDEPLRRAMEQESRLFFADFLENDYAMAALLRPDFAYLNDRLAAHYGLPPVGSEELVRVGASSAGRSGVLSLSAWLTVHSDAEHSSPIRRGRWLSDRILCREVPSPPAGLAVEPVALGDDVSVREQLERHRSDPQCASCHSLLDVLGIGLERLDGVGRVRAEPDIDSLGELPDGRTFEGPDELAYEVDPEAFVECVTRKLYTYSVGRPARVSDEPDIRAIAREAMHRGLTLPEVIREIVLTPGFRSPSPIERGEP